MSTGRNQCTIVIHTSMGSESDEVAEVLDEDAWRGPCDIWPTCGRDLVTGFSMGALEVRLTKYRIGPFVHPGFAAARHDAANVNVNGPLYYIISANNTNRINT